MMKPKGIPATARPLVRCAIYTRKSTEEGLQQEFNSLDAQRESAEAYIKSQAHEGWRCVPDRYDDGGFTGGNMDRPALKRLMDDIDTAKIDCVVVYKVDRLSRSLLDFARIMGQFEQRQVSFVSVTQQFNTATSMGRLVLNVLLSFAQFERELISERTRDKIAATRKKGKWTGGHAVLGYQVDPLTSKLVVYEEEAVRVRQIFQLYLKRKALLPVVQELNRRNWPTKCSTSKAGVERKGRPFDRTNLHRLLTNVLFIGQVLYKGQAYPGEHAGIVEPAVFRRVQELLQQKRGTARGRARNQLGALLMGILRCGPCQRAMSPAHSCKKPGRRYRYYTCTNAQKRGRQACPSRSVPAAQIEEFVVKQIRSLAENPALFGPSLTEADSGHVTRALAALGQRWGSLSPTQQARILHCLLERVDYDGSQGRVKITFRSSGIQTLIEELAQQPKERST